MEHSNPLINAYQTEFKKRLESDDPFLKVISNARIDSLIQTENVNDVKTRYSDTEYLFQQFSPYMLLPKGWYLTAHQYQNRKDKSIKGGSLERLLEWFKETGNGELVTPVTNPLTNGDEKSKWRYNWESLTFIAKHFLQLNKDMCGEFFVVNRNNAYLPIKGKKSVSKFIMEYFNTLNSYTDKTNFGREVPIFKEVFDNSGWWGTYDNELRKSNDWWAMRFHSFMNENEFCRTYYTLTSKADYKMTITRHKRAQTVEQRRELIETTYENLIEKIFDKNGIITNEEISNELSVIYPADSNIMRVKKAIVHIKSMGFDITKERTSKGRYLKIHNFDYTIVSNEEVQLQQS